MADAGAIPERFTAEILRRSGERESMRDIAAWLAGREPSLGSLRATAAADGVDLPDLLPWPAGVPAQPAR